MLSSPESIVSHEPKYLPAAWQQYSLQELGSWVHLLAARSKHRADPDKRAKDLTDAQNYLDMMQAHLDALRSGSASTEG